MSVAPRTTSPGLGTGATCDEVVGTGLQGLDCGNFLAPRTFTVNGMSVDCVHDAIITLPAARNGGYCMQASAGDYSYAYFSTF
jgi:hypothetical protein